MNLSIFARLAIHARLAVFSCIAVFAGRSSWSGRSLVTRAACRKEKARRCFFTQSSTYIRQRRHQRFLLIRSRQNLIERVSCVLSHIDLTKTATRPACARRE